MPSRPRIRYRMVAAAVAAVLLLAAWFGWWGSRRAPDPPERGKIRLAVLPFLNLSGDPGQDYFSNGLTEEMITQLGTLEPARLAVIARTSSMQYKDTRKDARQIASELGVNYIMEGSVRRDAGRVRITAILIRANDQTNLWAQTYDRDLTDILSLQNDVAGAIAREIRLKLTPVANARAASAGSLDPQAHELYLEGRYFWNRRTESGLLKAIESFNGAMRALRSTRRRRPNRCSPVCMPSLGKRRRAREYYTPCWRPPTDARIWRFVWRGSTRLWADGSGVCVAGEGLSQP